MSRRTKESMFQMGKEPKLPSCHNASVTPPSPLLTPPPRLLTPRISSPSPSLPPPPPSLSRSSGLLTPSPLPPTPPPSTPRSFSRLPPPIPLQRYHHRLHLSPIWSAACRLLFPPSLIWSAACRRSGVCRSHAWTRVSSVSPGRRTAASSTDGPDTS